MFKLLVIILAFNLYADTLPNGFLKSMDKKKVDLLQAINGDFTVINFWFLACEPCKKEMKLLFCDQDQNTIANIKCVKCKSDDIQIDLNMMWD